MLYNTVWEPLLSSIGRILSNRLKTRTIIL